MKFNLFKENLRIALYSIRSNLLRTILTIIIIKFGIFALTGILTATDAIKSSISNEFTRMGANTFTIRNRDQNVRMGGRRHRVKNYSRITFRQAEKFKENFKFPALVSISIRLTGNATIKYKSEKTNPNIPAIGTDVNNLSTAGFEIESGRNFTELESRTGRHVAILGKELADNLFKKENPIGKVISAGSNKYKVIGVLKSKGSSVGFNDDKVIMVPVANARQYFARPNMSFNINVLPNNNIPLNIAISEAEGTFRVIRKLSAKDESDFSIIKSDNLANMLLKNISYVTAAAFIIAIITLFGAAVGLMNIMLVSVSERTREVGIRKALGATSTAIRQQFLFESVFISLLGGAFGIILGILGGNGVALILGGRFIVPWTWILLGVLLCLIVGILSGMLPAVKASKLDPIEALRYE